VKRAGVGLMLGAALASAPIACGGGGGAGTGTTTAARTTTPAGTTTAATAAAGGHVIRGRVLCRRLVRDTRALSSAGASGDAAARVAQVIALERDAVRRLRAIHVPASLRDDRELVLGIFLSEVRLLEEAANRVEAGESPVVALGAIGNRLVGIRRRIDRTGARAKARALGLEDCLALVTPR
jgi:hypothetical protein